VEKVTRQANDSYAKAKTIALAPSAVLCG